jgi:plasmid maintenance system antidote protein VapI
VWSVRMAIRMATSLGVGTSMPFDLQKRLSMAARDGPAEKIMSLVKDNYVIITIHYLTEHPHET